MPDAILLLVEEGDCAETTLDAFLSANDFDDAEVERIRRGLRLCGHHHGGGGAAPMWTVCTPAWLRSRRHGERIGAAGPAEPSVQEKAI